MNIVPDDESKVACAGRDDLPHGWVIVCEICGAYGYHQDGDEAHDAQVRGG